MNERGSWDRRRILRWLALAPGAGLGAAAGLSAVDVERLVAAWRNGVPTGCRTWPECLVTGADVQGPFYVAGAPRRMQVAGPDEPGDRIVVRGTVIGPDCKTPLAGALVDVWQADAEGSYHGKDENYRLRGQVLTDDRGRYTFESVVPGNYKIDPAAERFRPAHIHYTVSAPGHRALTTQLYFKGDPWLAPNDPCGRECRSDDPGRIVDLVRERDGAARFAAGFDIVLAKA